VRSSTLLVLLLLMSWIMGGPASAAATTFNFTFEKDPTGVYQWVCNTSNYADVGCGHNFFNPTPDIDKTKFVYGDVTIDGQDYWHMIIGEPADGWAQEVFLLKSAANFSMSNGETNPLGSSSNGIGYPTSAAIKTIANETNSYGTISMEFLKDTIGNKPKVSTNITSGVMTMNFESDMRGMDYNTTAPAANVTSTLTLADPDIPQAESFSLTGSSSGDFDMATDTQYSVISAGQVTYDEVTQTYEYVNPVDDYNLGQSWDWYFDASQNPTCDPIRPEC